MICSTQDLGSKGASGSDASSGFGRAFPVLSPWRIDRALAATQKDEWHNADDLIPMAKRNTDNKSKSFLSLSLSLLLLFFFFCSASLTNAILECGSLPDLAAYAVW